MKIDLILLASGSSRRFGSNKLQYYTNGYQMYMYSLWNALLLKARPENNIGDIYFVSKYPALLQAAEKYQAVPIFNTRSQEGISASIRCGVNASWNDACLFLLCDQPYLKICSVERLIQAYRNSPHTIACMAGDGFLGIPAVFSKEHRKELLRLEGDSGGKSILRKYDPHLCKYQIPDMTELKDIDRKEF